MIEELKQQILDHEERHKEDAEKILKMTNRDSAERVDQAVQTDEYLGEVSN